MPLSPPSLLPSISTPITTFLITLHLYPQHHLPYYPSSLSPITTFLITLHLYPLSPPTLIPLISTPITTFLITLHLYPYHHLPYYPSSLPLSPHSLLPVISTPITTFLTTLHLYLPAPACDRTSAWVAPTIGWKIVDRIDISLYTIVSSACLIGFSPSCHLCKWEAIYRYSGCLTKAKSPHDGVVRHVRT